MDAMHDKNAETLIQHMSKSVTLRSPILPDPVEGREAVGGLFAALLTNVDDFTITNMIAAGTNAAVFVIIRAGNVRVEGVDDMHVDVDGLVCAMTVQWHPLAQVVAMQQRLAATLEQIPITLDRTQRQRSSLSTRLG